MTRSTAESDHPTILVVDDNPAALYVKSRLLSRQSYRVIEADNGADALSVATTKRPALILLDVNLSDINGFDVCHQLKTQPETKFIKILQTSAARINAPDRVKSLEVGADAYLVEPAEEEELIGTVQALLKLAQHERENQRLIARLTESETRYRSLIERMPAAMYTIDRDGRITFYNDQAAELWGRRPNLDDSESRFCGSHKLLWPDGTALLHDKTPMVDAVRDGTALHGQEVIIEQSDGTRRHVIVHIDPLRNAEGHIVGAVNLFTDLTARKQAEDALRDSKSRLTAELGIMQRLQALSTKLIHTGELPSLLQEILAASADLIGTDKGTIQLLDHGTGNLRIVAHQGIGTRLVEHFAERGWVTTGDAARQRDQRVIVEDVAGDPGVQGAFEREIVLEDGIRAIQSTPLISRDGRFLGLLNNHFRQVHRPSESDLRCLDLLARMAADFIERCRIDDALRESKTRFRLLADAAPVFIWISGTDKRLTYFNQGWLDFTGRTMEQEIGDGWAEGVHPDDYERCLKAYVDAFDRREPFTMEYRLRRADGRYGWIVDQAVPLWGGDREFQGYIGACVDITDRKQAEDALRASEERSRMLAEAMPHFVWQTDEQGETSFENQRWYDYTGLTHETTRHDGWLTVQHPDDAPRLADAWKKAVETGGEYDGETRLLRAVDGTYRWFRVRGAPVRDPEGRIQSWVGTCTDIHDRKEAELALRESEERYRATFANAAVGIAHSGLDGRWLQFNDSLCTITGYFCEELLTMTFADITYPGDLKSEWAQARRALAGEIEIYSVEKRYVRKDGSLIWVHKTVSLLRDAHRRPLHFISIIEDIHDRKQAEDALREAQARLQRWNVELEQAVNMKTAELRQSQDRLRALTSELNLAEQRERKRLATELHDHLQQMLVVGKLTIGQGKWAASGVSACETVLKKVDDILSDALTYSRTLVAELSPPVLRDHGLTASLKWLAEYMKKKHEQTVAVAMSDDQGFKLPEDQRVLIFQSVRELLINSAKYAGTGQATLTMEERADQLCITVKDEGTGFDLAAAASAGVPSGEISSKFGLYSIQERMRALGGSFTIHSAPGCGTSATLILPRTSSEGWGVGSVQQGRGEAHTSSLPTVHSPLIAGAIHVLLVDDHAMVRQGLRSVLDAYADIQVMGEARDGVEAVKLVEKLRPRVVVMDINMPKMNGVEATTQIKAKWPETTIIGISVNVGDDNRDAMQRAGAATLLTKEAAVEQLHDMIVQVVGSQETQGGPVIPR